MQYGVISGVISADAGRAILDEAARLAAERNRRLVVDCVGNVLSVPPGNSPYKVLLAANEGYN